MNDYNRLNDYNITKLWHSIKKKYKRLYKKQQSLYNDEIIDHSISDTESDKTNKEINSTCNSSRSLEKSITTKYDKRNNSLDIVRNNEDNYEVVLPYQRRCLNASILSKKNP